MYVIVSIFIWLINKMHIAIADSSTRNMNRLFLIRSKLWISCILELRRQFFLFSGQRGYLIGSESSDQNLITNSDGTYSTYLDLDISVTRSLIGSVYVCEVTLDGVNNWNMSKRHQVDVNSKL